MIDPRELHSTQERAAHLKSTLELHADQAAQRALAKLGGPLSAATLTEFLDTGLRFPTTLLFDGEGLEPHQFAHPSFVVRDGAKYCELHIRPRFEVQTEDMICIVAYMAAAINYLDAVSSTLCENFGAMLLGVPAEGFYKTICRIADEGAH